MNACSHGFWRHSATAALALAVLVMPVTSVNSVSAQNAEKKKAGEKDKDKSEKSDRAKAAGKQGKMAQFLANRGASFAPVALPRDVDKIPAKKSTGKTYLPLSMAAALAKPLSAEDLDEIVASEMITAGNTKAERKAPDEIFVRRAYLDVLGILPAPADVEEYAADTSPDKKSKLVEKLLANPRFGTNWARYWRDTIVYRQTAGENRYRPFEAGFETWMAEQFNQNKNWGEIVEKMLTATGLSDETPQGLFMASHGGEAAETAGEASRIFLGVQIACAQCHDHPTDTWKRDQFHEFATFFGKASVRPRQDLRETKGLVVEVAAKQRGGEYRKPNMEDPSDPGQVVDPVFLTGQPYPLASDDKARRQAAADFITSKKNPYFAKAFVNRAWSELMGQGFMNPVDDLGADKEVVYPKVFDALSKSFAATNYDIKGLYRTILNSKVYDRLANETDGSTDLAVAFRTVNPSRLTADQIFDSLDWVLGGGMEGTQMARGKGMAQGKAGAYARRFGVRGTFRQVFGFDPSLDKESIEGSITQALAIMNGPSIHSKLSGSNKSNVLHKILDTNKDDREALKMIYLRTLSRKPTSEELVTNIDYIKQVGSRTEAFEDIFWALLNSTEFLYNH